MSQAATYVPERLDHLGIVAGVCQEIGLAAYLDALDTGYHARVSVGTATVARILNGLGWSLRRLYLVPQFFADKPVETLLGPGITANDLNDECLGRALDWLYAHDPTAWFAGITAQARRVFGITARQIHVDTTSFSVSGAYLPEEGDLDASVIAITYGYSRDHRADLKQWMFALGTTLDGDIPVFLRPLDGNSSDQRTRLAAVLDPRRISDQELITIYKEQGGVEHGFRFLKDPLFLASSVFLKKPARILGLSFIMALCLLIYRLAEHRLRLLLLQTDQTIADQLGKPTNHPTLRWVFQCIEGIDLLHIHSPPAGRQPVVLRLKPLHEQILALLGPYATLRRLERTAEALVPSSRKEYPAMNVTRNTLQQALRSLGVSGQPVCVHASLRSFGWIEGGASTIIQGFLAESCTLLVPTFSWDTFGVSAPVGMRPERNGYDYARPRPPAPGVNRMYTRAAAEVDADMGMLPAAVLALPGHLRGNHPLCSFTAVGPHAPALMAEQAPLQVLAPLSALAAAQGWVLLLGVGLESMTLLHLAEQRAGRCLFRRWANGPTGVPEEVEVGGCSAGFEQVAPRLAALEQRIQVGQSLWRVFPAQAALEVAQRAIQQQPSITQCADADCGRCRDSIAGGPLPTPQTPDAS